MGEEILALQHKTKTQNGHIKSIEGRDLELIIYLEKDLESAWQDDFKKRGKNITKEDYRILFEKGLADYVKFGVLVSEIHIPQWIIDSIRK